MLRIRAAYANERGGITGAPQLKWPQVCACCGQPNSGGTYTLNHLAREGGGGTIVAGGMAHHMGGGSNVNFGMSWPVPCCSACQVHSRKSRNPLRLKWTVIYGGIPTMFLGGFALWSMGVANNPDATADPVGTAMAFGFVGLNFVAWYGVWRLVGGLMRLRGRLSTRPGCADSLAPVAANSDSRFVRFDFTSDAYAASVAQANGLSTEPARFAKVPVLVGNMLARLGV